MLLYASLRKESAVVVLLHDIGVHQVVALARVEQVDVVVLVRVRILERIVGLHAVLRVLRACVALTQSSHLRNQRPEHLRPVLLDRRQILKKRLHLEHRRLSVPSPLVNLRLQQPASHSLLVELLVGVVKRLTRELTCQ